MKRVHGFALGLLLVAGCASAPVDTTPRIDFDHGTDFRIYKTYRWFDGPFVPGDPATRDEAQYRTVRDAVNLHLKEKGYDWQQFSPTDLVIHMHSGFDVPQKPENWMTYNWYKPWWGAYGPMAAISRYDDGTLVLDVIDAERTELIWRGLLPVFYSSDGRIADVETLGPRIRDLLKDFPAAIR
ncbi:MAG: DUF4136 domain-containing protein [Bacteroidota bacterium]|nr:DUF4136 domain-containing protein [Bacteroidota bacterium]